MNKEEAIKQLGIILQNIIEERKQGIASIEGIKFQEALQTVLNLIQKQEKIIDEMKLQIYQMAKYISYLDIEEDICVKNVTNPQLCNEEYINCIECIKEYFKKEVEKE